MAFNSGEGDIDYDVVASFVNEEEALQELKKYKSKCEYMRGFHGGFYYLTAYAVEAYEAEENGDFLDGSDFYPSEEDWSWKEQVANS